MIDFNRPYLTGREGGLIADAIARTHISGGGHYTAEVEQALGELIGSQALLMTSCTHALEASASLAAVGPGDEVLLPAFGFVSVANAFYRAGARVRLVDSRPDTLNIDVERVADAMSECTKAVCAIHYGGVAAEPDRLVALCQESGAMFIEDNAHGLGGSFKGRSLGAFGSLATLSFHETKNITCGEGGALLVNEPSLVERAEILREKGTDRSRFLRGLTDKYTWVDAGSSWVLSEILAAFLAGQVGDIEAVNETRRKIWDAYYEELTSWAFRYGVQLPHVPADCVHTGHVFYMLLPTTNDRDRMIGHLRDRGIQAVFHYVPLHLSPMGEKLGYRPGDFPVAESAASRLVRLPIYPALSADEFSRVVQAVLDYVPSGGLSDMVHN
jgi:dTDP-4-amino-4,6-dideoxygalactose transaminase